MPKKKSAKTSALKVEEKREVVETQEVEVEERSAEKPIQNLKSPEKLLIELENRIVALENQKSVTTTLEVVNDLEIKVKKLHEDSKLPVRAHSTDAGLDLFAYEDFTLEMLERKLVGTGIAMQIPDGYVGFIKEKSGLACKGLRVAAGVVDSGFTDEVKVLLFNPKGFSWKDGKRDGVGGKLSFKKGEKIAQMVVLPVNLGEVIEVDELDESDRGESGWGSTGHE